MSTATFRIMILDLETEIVTKRPLISSADDEDDLDEDLDEDLDDEEDDFGFDEEDEDLDDEE